MSSSTIQAVVNPRKKVKIHEYPMVGSLDNLFLVGLSLCTKLLIEDLDGVP